MDALTRRRFLLASGVAAGSALAMGAGAMTLAELLQSASAPDAADGSAPQRLVLLTLYGGNDGLNTVIPYADSAYYSARPELAYAPEKVLRLDDTFGLNPTLPGVKRLWDEKRLAIVHGVGYPKPDRSHFRSMDIWQTGAPVNPVSSGWIGRWLDGTGAPPSMAVSFEPVLPVVLAGDTRAGACVTMSGLKLPAGLNEETLEQLGRGIADEPAAQARAAKSYADLVSVDRLIRSADQQPAGAKKSAEPGVEPSNPLAVRLARVARCVEAGVPTRVYSVSLDGFDTHAVEVKNHERRLKLLDEALAWFTARLGRTDAGRKVTVLVYSEFGRRVKANASDGTDHGTAGPVFVLGHRVAGGFYGEQPSLTDLDRGDLKAGVDFRDVYATVLASVLQADPGKYLGGYDANPVPFLVQD
jgi:uncharacterized protein (DUF1501 family)